MSTEGGAPKRLTAAEKRAAEEQARRDRDERIYGDWRLGVSPSTLAIRHDLSVRQVERIVSALADAAIEGMTIRTARGPSALREMDQMLLQVQHDVEEAASLFVRARDHGNENTALGALRTLGDCRARLLDLKQRRGLIPHDLSQIAGFAGMAELVKDIVTVFDQEQVPQTTIDRVAALIEMRVERAGSGLQLVERGETIEAA